MKLEKFFFFLNGSKDFEVPSLCYWWLIVAFFFLIMEMGHPGLFFFLSFFFGGLSAALASYITQSITAQMFVFIVGTVISMYILRQWGISLVRKNRSHQQTNFYVLQGKRAVAIQDISYDKPGLVKIGGQVWAARVSHDNSIRIGDVVEVIDVRGAHVVVKKV